MYINHFVVQEQGREAIDDMNSLIVKDQNIKISLSWHNLKLPEFKDSSVNKSIIKLNSGERYIAWQWHYTNGKHVNKGVDARLNN